MTVGKAQEGERSTSSASVTNGTVAAGAHTFNDRMLISERLKLT